MNYIQEKRVAAGLTQDELATKLQVTIATVSRWENDKATPHKNFKRQMEVIFEAAS